MLKSTDLPNYNQTEFRNWAQKNLLLARDLTKTSFHGQPAQYTMSEGGAASNGKAVIDLYKWLTKFSGFRHIIIETSPSYCYITSEWDGGSLFLVIKYRTGYVEYSVTSNDTEILKHFREWDAENLTSRSIGNKGRVKILVNREGNVQAADLGFASVPLSLVNYHPQQRESIKELIQELSSPFPKGRLNILEGPPGGGKTFLIRSIIDSTPDATFVFIPPAMIPNLGDPSLVTALLDINEEEVHYGSGSHPIILICEDADSILVSRRMDNMPSVSSLLNLSSGILGDLIDIRVVATTNARRSDIDPAILREGRLSSYIRVNALPKENAEEALSRILQREVVDVEWDPPPEDSGVGFSSSRSSSDEVLLASVYAKARSMGWVPEKDPPRFAGIEVVEVPDFVTKTYPDDMVFDGTYRGSEGSGYPDFKSLFHSRRIVVPT